MKLRISIDGKTYEVDVEVADDDHGPHWPGQAHHPAAPPTASAPPAAGSHPPVTPPTSAPPAHANGEPVDESKVCRSPIVGVVVRVAAQVGQMLQPNDPLVVLEAMKMESNITAPVAGKVKRINVKPGDGVQIGQILVELE